MKLRKVTMLAVFAIFVSMTLFLYVYSSIVLIDGFVKIEEKDVRKNVQRAVEALSNEKDRLLMTNRDWAWWDDTYAFVADNNTGYIYNNLMDETFATLGLNLMLFVNESGGLVYGKAFDLVNAKETPLPAGVQGLISTGSLLMQHAALLSNHSGIALLPQAPVIVSSCTILDSLRQGPVRGTLIFGKYLNPAEVQNIATITHLSITVRRYDDTQNPQDFQDARSSLSDTSAIFVQPLNGDTVAGYVLRDDIYGSHALILKVDMPRDIYNQGQTTVRYILAAILVTGIIVGIIAAVFIERLFTSRITKLSRQINSIGKSRKLSSRVSIEGSDELALLASHVNGMLQALERSIKGKWRAEDEHEESELRFKSVVESVTEAIVSADKDGKIVLWNKGAQNTFGYTWKEILGKPLTALLAEEFKDSYDAVFRVLQLGVKSQYLMKPFETRGVRKDGSKFPMDVSIGTYKWKDGVYFTAVIRDLSGKENAEKKQKI